MKNFPIYVIRHVLDRHHVACLEKFTDSLTYQLAVYISVRVGKIILKDVFDFLHKVLYRKEKQLIPLSTD